MKHIYPFLILFVTVLSCDDSSDNIFCVSGDVVGYEPCGGFSVIEVDLSQRIGGEVQLGQRTLKNAIQVPGEFATGRGYFRIRAYRESDASLANPTVYCLAIYAPLAIPYYTVIDRNDSRCPQL
jgi:hypothetical protein